MAGVLKNTQEKLVYAVTSHTPAEIIKGRADSKSNNMGLTNWPNENIRKTDVSTSKNFLAEGEVKELNRLTTILLDIFEDQLDIGKLTMMSEAEEILDRQLQQLNRVVLRHGGKVKMTSAKAFAEREYGKFKDKRKAIRHEEADKSIAEIKSAQKKLPRGKKNRPE